MTESGNKRISKADNLIYAALAEIYASNAGFGEVKIAESRLLEVLKMNPRGKDLTEAHNLLAQLYAQTGRFEKGIEHLEAALNNSPEVAADLTLYLAEILESHKKWENAIEVYNLGLTHCQDAGLYQGLAFCLGKKGNLEKAETYALKAAELAPEDASCSNDLGFILMQQGKYEQDQDHFERALKIDPAYQLARSNLDLCSRRILVSKKNMKNKYTPRQGQYLAFIYQYSLIHEMPPAETELERYFHVASSSVHQMILTLEKRGLIMRTPGVARTIKVLLPENDIPALNKIK
jgi:tetratricopeptide (TPR) repeat protein